MKSNISKQFLNFATESKKKNPDNVQEDNAAEPEPRHANCRRHNAKGKSHAKATARRTARAARATKPQDAMTEDKTFERADFAEGMPDKEFCDCTFRACNFADCALGQTRFDQCRFEACNLAMAKFEGAVRDTAFADCKMTGCDFAGTSRFSGGLRFERSQLDYANFADAKLPGTRFRECRAFEACFDGAGLKGAVFDRCDLERASFAGADLERADFSTAFNFAIDPASCRLKKAVFSEQGLRGLTAHLNIIVKEPGA